MMKKSPAKILLCLFMVVLLCFAFASPSYANVARIAQGVAKTFGSVLALPLSIVEDSTRVVFPVGLLTGTVKGVVRMLAGTVEGVLDIGVGAAPYAKYLVFFI